VADSGLVIAFTTIGDAGVRVEQWCDAPTVYLDHWALRRISESAALARAFSVTLKARGGTLALSWLNLVEFSKLTDAKQAAQADALLDEVKPRLFFLNPDFFKVIGEEDRLQAGGPPSAPHADQVSLRFFAKHNLLKPGALELLPKQNLFQLSQKAGVVAKFETFADGIVARIESLRQDYRANRDFSLAVKRVPKGKPIQRGTWFVAREVLGALLVDTDSKVNRHDAVDACHAIVPASYCDFVLLDRRWKALVERARRRFAEGGLSFQVAKVYSESGLQDFLAELGSVGGAAGG
jgi:hypothetical protein